jgi:predicted transposase YbfD/YdcC
MSTDVSEVRAASIIRTINMQAVQGIQKKRFWCYLKMQPAMCYISIRQNWLIFLMLPLLNLKEQNGFRVIAT